uniref:Uncharacterized protein n=1 Tax=Anguilla anguilla TaxID=7936 RepID=A0A0E9PFV4_ANGAN
MIGYRSTEFCECTQCIFLIHSKKI